MVWVSGGRTLALVEFESEIEVGWDSFVRFGGGLKNASRVLFDIVNIVRYWEKGRLGSKMN